jgi:CHAD domain-containing protein
MAYRFKRREPIAGGFRRIADEQIAGLLRDIESATTESIHDARRRCKMLRALLALADEALDTRARARANEAVEKISRALAPVRDAEVRLQTLETLLAPAAARPTARFAQVRSLLQAQATAARRLVLTAGDWRDVAALVRSAHERMQALEFSCKGWRALGPGLTRSFRRGRQGLAASLDDPSPEVRHQWRKHVKLLWNHVRLLHGCQPRRLGAVARQLATLGETLGAEHDLAVLRQHLVQHGKRHREPAAFGAIVDLIDTRRALERRSADALGGKLYRRKPAVFAAQIERAWKRWRE